MYQYDRYDRTLVTERARQFDGQVERRLGGEIREDEFKPLRLQNGLYMQLHAYMLRVNIPYGLLSSTQLRMLAHVARRYDRGYGHFTTRQNIQFNWPKLKDVPRILADLARVEMHAIQSSGNCIRNTTADPLAGVARGEIEDPRMYAEIIRQWSTLHPEFAFLPRKFKIAFSGTPGQDRAAVRLHDIGIRIVKNADGETGFEVWVGGGLGRSPFVGKVLRDFLPKEHLLSFVESILRVYNRFGRRDNRYKARIKILVDALGLNEFRARVEHDWEHTRDGVLRLTKTELARIGKHFASPSYESFANSDAKLRSLELGDDPLGRWVGANVSNHKQPGYGIVTVSLKNRGTPPGDVSDFQMDRIADLADRYSFGEIRTTHTQNLVLADVRVDDLGALHTELDALGLASANLNRVTDLICCPGLDFCNLASARSIPVALEIRERFDDVDYLNDIGEVSLKISGCINACGHHHVGNIGILGVDKQGVEFYQLMLGGSANDDASLGTVVGPAFARQEIVDAVGRVLDCYLKARQSSDERFIECFRRVGLAVFQKALYGD